MDDIVIRGLAKWPDVPAVYGWLALDRRGAWLLKGEKIANPAVTGFIGRNYEHDERGRWFFQNGPQRVYVSLDYTPFVYRAIRATDGTLHLEAQNGKRTRAGTSAWIDEEGAVLVETDVGIGIVHDKDLHVVLSALADAEGNRLDEDDLESRIQRLQQGDDVVLYLHGLQQALRVQTIRCDNVAEKFKFEACPSVEAGLAST